MNQKIIYLMNNNINYNSNGKLYQHPNAPHENINLNNNNNNIEELKKQFKSYVQNNANNNKESLISTIDSNLDFYYNSLNICLGKPGQGKTTLLLKQLMLLNNVPNNYEFILYLSNTDDKFFNETIKMFNKIPVVHKTFEEGTECLDEYLVSDQRRGHIFVIIEDATGLLEGRNITWEQWLIKLRHLKMTVWINLHEWVGISAKIREQVACVFICKGYGKQKCGVIFRQLNIPYDCKIAYGFYNQLRNFEYLKIDNIKGKLKVID